MNRLGFLGRVSAVFSGLLASTFVPELTHLGSSAKAEAEPVFTLPSGITVSPGKYHLSILPDSPWYGGHLAQRAQVTFRGEPAKNCVQASEADGFIIQRCLGTTIGREEMTEVGAEFIAVPPGQAGPLVKRYGHVTITLPVDVVRARAKIEPPEPKETVSGMPEFVK